MSPPHQLGMGAVSAHTAHNRPDYVISSHKILRTSSYKVCSDRLTIRFFIATMNQETLATVTPSNISSAKWAWFQWKVCVVQKFHTPPPPQTSSYAYAASACDHR